MLYFILGLILITLIGTLGAILSRKLSFNYTWFSILSSIVFIGVGYVLSKKADLSLVLLLVGLLGLYDGSIGLRLSLFFKANNGLDQEKAREMVSVKTAIGMMGIACFFGFIGYLIASKF